MPRRGRRFAVAALLVPAALAAFFAFDVVAIAIGLAWFGGGVAHAERSPGPLAAAHQALDTPDQCGACHSSGHQLSNDRCLGCHEHDALRRRMAERKGFHSSEKVGNRACYLCHTDHKGRAREISGFAALGGIARFDHQLTSWPLTGAHAGKKCDSCHTKSGTFLGAPATCDGCHKSPHGDLRAPLRRCERCHGVRDWKPLGSMSFDHNNPADARFSLEGKHAALECKTCHAKGAFRSASASAGTDCATCHKSPHAEPAFAKRRCADCHSEKVEWTATRFDHARQTRFALDGQHAKTACVTCHPANSKTKLQRACTGCHDNVHDTRFANFPDCGRCHTARHFTSDFRFDHGKSAGYVLTGKHAEVACRACHRGASPTEFERLDGIVKKGSVACMSCHRHENVHSKQYKNDECLKCHVAAGKKQFKAEAVQGFHGEGSRFPLLEAHAQVACDGCHKNGAFQGTETECGPACHADRLHKGTLEGACSRCHEGAHWAATRFDHDDSRYPLTGHHTEVACELCHVSKVYRPTTTKCGECHGKDDAHGKTLGTQCERCHTPSGRSLFDHNDPRAVDRFRLDGKHLAVACKSCHPNTEFKKTPTACEGCHGEPAQHRGQLGTRCAACHDSGSWKTLHTRHDVGAVRLGGAHDRLPCVTCHTGGRPLGGTGELCIGCHRSDDIHHNSLGPRCGECHLQQTWSGSQVRFFHERTGCSLRGLHRTLPCLDCHVGGNFAALATSCVACHRADAIRGAKDPLAPAGHAGLSQCGGCHNVSFFAPARGGGGSESVCQ